ncbi:MAG: substrate-binding domain-containing protein, partial [Mycobacterium sp.]
RAAGLDELIQAGGLTEREGAAAASSLLAADALPDAVFAFNDRCALGVMDVLIRSGVAVPQQVSVMGFDDSPLAGLAHISLTTIRQDCAALAGAAVERLVARLEGTVEQADVVDVVCEPALVMRGSTVPRR